MYDRLLYLYQQKRINYAQLEVAVSKTWISEDDKAKIIASVSSTSTAS